LHKRGEALRDITQVPKGSFPIRHQVHGSKLPFKKELLLSHLLLGLLNLCAQVTDLSMDPLIGLHRLQLGLLPLLLDPRQTNLQGRPFLSLPLQLGLHPRCILTSLRVSNLCH
jgi:hypothetical protein